jgi:hypothetical protein
MEKSHMLLVLLTVMLVKTAEAQVDSSQHAPGKKPPVTEGPSRTKQSPSQADQFRKEDRIIVEREKLPDVLRRTLNESDRYKGWQNSTIYFDRSVKQYILHLGEANTTRTYRFDEDGKPVNQEDVIRKNDQ